MPLPAPTKQILILGQSNANRVRFVWTGKSEAAIYQNGVDATSLGVSPFHWGPTDPNGYRAAAEAAVTDRLIPPDALACLWFQGENDAIAGSDHYGADLEELILDMDERLGRVDMYWGIIRLNLAYTESGLATAPNIALVRAGQTAVAAAYPTRVALLDVDDLDPVVGVDGHYASASYITIWGRFLDACATHFGDASWNT